MVVERVLGPSAVGSGSALDVPWPWVRLVGMEAPISADPEQQAGT